MNKTDFDPITRLPVIAYVIDEMLEKVQCQENCLKRATHLSLVLKKDQYKLIKSQYRMQLDDAREFSSLLTYWHEESADEKCLREIAKTSIQLGKLTKVINTVILMLSKAPTF